MTIIPIIFTFDSKLVCPASVCITSLAMAAAPDTFYDIIILYSGDAPALNEKDLCSSFPNIRISYRSIGNEFSNGYEIRGITRTAYYRLLAAKYIPEYDKAIYSDVDVIFRMDLASTFAIDLTDKYLGAVSAINLQGSEYARRIGLSYEDSYFCSGFLVMNLKKMRDDDISTLFLKESEHQYKYQDQDIMNIVCKGKILELDRKYIMGVYEYLKSATDTSKNVSEKKADDLFKDCIIHYYGQKPWEGLCPNFDIWWECYRRSPIFDQSYYFKFFYNKLEPLEHLSLKQRIKTLVRYFVYGKKKDI